MTETSEPPSIFTFRLDGTGGAMAVDRDAVPIGPAPGEAFWVHLDRSRPDCVAWLNAASGLDEIVREALLAEEIRPRYVTMDNGVLLFLRGVNLNPGADPEDMVSVRLWIEDRRLISVRLRPTLAVQDIRTLLERGTGPKTVTAVLAALAGRLAQRMEPVISDLDDRLDGLEQRLIEAAPLTIRSDLVAVRQTAISLRRYIAPQRDALSQLVAVPPLWFAVGDIQRLREAADRVMRYVEELDALRERAAVIQDELLTRLAEKNNRTTYILTIVAAIFLPLGLLSGMMGMNVGGIPGSDTPYGFLIVSAAMIGIAGVLVWAFRKLRWL